jgi:hypothetical protein
MVGLKRDIKGSSHPRVMASMIVQFTMPSVNTAISATKGGPHMISTRALVGDGVDAGDAVGAADDIITTTHGAPKSSLDRCGEGVNYATNRTGHHVG